MGFSIPQLNSSCCGCTLRTGSLIALWGLIVLNIIALVAPPLAQQVLSSNSTIPAGSTATTPAPSNNLPPIPPLTIWNVIFRVISLVVDIVGLYGIYKDLHFYLIPFLVWMSAFVIEEIWAFIVSSLSVSLIIVEFMFIFLFFYSWLVVFSHYRVLKGSARPIQA